MYILVCYVGYLFLERCGPMKDKVLERKVVLSESPNVDHPA
jgi:hypothetical protein